MKIKQFTRSALALLLMLASLVSLVPAIFATEAETEENDQIVLDVDEIAEEAELDPESESYEEELVQALQDAYGLTPEESEDTEFGYLTNEERIQAGLESKGNTRDVRGPDYVFLDFKIASASRNFNWQVQTGSSSQQYFAANKQGLLAGYFSGDDPRVYMPIETHDSGLKRLNSYVLDKADIIQVHIYETTENKYFTSTGTGTYNSYFTIRTSNDNDAWASCGSTTIKRNLAAQTLKFNVPDGQHGKTLHGVRWDPIQPTDAQKGTFTEHTRIYIDYIYIGPESTKPVMVEFVNESGSLMSQGRGYVGYGKKAPDWSTGKANSETSTTRTIYGWQLYVKNDAGTWVDQKKFVADPKTITCYKDTRFKLIAVTLPKVTKNNSAQTYNTGISTTDDKYVVSCDTYDIASSSVGSYGTPLDVCIVIDRSASQAELSGGGSFKTKADMTAYLDKLDKRKWPGYYRATVWRRNNSMTDNPKATDYQMFFPMRYYRGQWQMQVISNDCDCNGTKYRNYGVVPWNSTGMKQCSHVVWVSMSAGYDRYVSLLQAQGYSISSAPFKIGPSRLGKEQSAVETFMQNLYNSIPNLKPGENHKFSVLAYGQTVLETGYPYGDEISAYKSNNQDCSEDAANFDHTTYEKFLQCIRGTYVYGATRTDCALMVLSNEVSRLEKEVNANDTTPYFKSTKFLADATSNRERVIILMTDGVPTATKPFTNNLATDAIDASRRLKAKQNTTVYVIAIFPGLDSTKKYNKEWDGYKESGANDTENPTEAQRANNFMNLVSSNYKEAKNYYTPVSSYTGTHYFSDASGAGDIADAFTTIWNDKAPSLKPGSSFTGSGSLWLYEEFGREWILDPDNSIKVYAAPHTGDVTFGDRVLMGEHKVTLTGSKQTINGNGYILYVEPKGEGFTVTLKWTDAKTAYIRNTALSTDIKGTASGLTTNKGYKISMDIPVEVNKARTLGGNNIPLTKAGSGGYIAGSGDTDKASSATFPYSQPNANVSYSTTNKAYDYFIPRDEYIALHNGTSDAGRFGTLMENMVYVDTGLTLADSNNKSMIDYLNIDVNVQSAAGSVIYNKKATSGTTAFVNNADLANAKANLLNDTVLTLRTVMAPKYNATDSFGRAPYPTFTVDANPVYYVPKFAVVDFGDNLQVPLGGLEGADANKIGGYASGTFDSAKKEMIYVFDKKMFNTTAKTIPYTFTCTNRPKNATSNVISREVTVVPGNVMTYDDDMLTYAGAAQLSSKTEKWTSKITGKEKTRTITENRVAWTSQGSKTNIVQTFDNTASHGGYDAKYATTGNFHGSTMVATVGETNTYDSDGELIKKVSNSTAQTQFTFKGTGFEIISRTTKDSGVLLAEVFSGTSIGANATPVKSILCNTYLSTADYNQAPVIRWTGAYGDYTVRLTAYYNVAFAYRSVKNAMTEEEAKAILGYDDSVDFTYIESKGLGSGERGLASSYNVYVDGIRVFNPLNQGDTVSQYIYSLAKEGFANFGDIQNIVLDSTNWKGGQATGMLYLADRNINVGNNTQEEQLGSDIGFPLFMNGELSYDKVGGKTYFKDKDENRIKDPATGYEIYSIFVNGSYKYRIDKATETTPYTELSRDYVRSVLVDFSGYFYNKIYRSYGAKNEVQLKTGEGVAFAADAGSLHLSLKSVNGTAVKVQVWNGSTFVDYVDPKGATPLTALTSTTEMFFDFSKYKGTVIIKNAGSGILSICQVKYVGGASATSMAVYVDEEVAMAAMAAFEGAEPVTELDSLKLSHSLNLRSNIGINYIVPKTALADFDHYALTCTVGEDTYVLSGTENGEYVYFTLDCLTAAQMNDNVHAVLNATKGEESFVSPADDYTIATYAFTMMNKEGVSEQVKSLCANLLRYGAATQTFLGQTEAGLADEELTAEQRAYLRDLETVELANHFALLDDVVDPTVTWFGKTLALESTVALKFVVDASAFVGDVTALELRVAYTGVNGEAKELTLAPTVYNAEKSLYLFTLDQLDAAELRSVLTCQVFAAGEAVSQTMTYSADSYANGKTGTLLELCKALFAYVDEAKALFAS